MREKQFLFGGGFAWNHAAGWRHVTRRGATWTVREVPDIFGPIHIWVSGAY